MIGRTFGLYNHLKEGKPSKKRNTKLLLLEEALSRTTKRFRQQQV